MVYKKLTALHLQKSVSLETCIIPLAPRVPIASVEFREF